MFAAVFTDFSRNPAEPRGFTVVSANSTVCIFPLHSNQVTAEILMHFQFSFLDHFLEFFWVLVGDPWNHLFLVKPDVLFLWWSFALRLSKRGSTLLEAVKVYPV